jgi:hypothetical protein
LRQKGGAYRVLVVDVSKVIIGGQVDRVYHVEVTPKRNNTSENVGRRCGTNFMGWVVERRQRGGLTDSQLGDGDEDARDEPVDPGSGCPAAMNIEKVGWDQLVYV